MKLCIYKRRLSAIISACLIFVVAFSVAHQAFAYPFGTATTELLTASDSPRDIVTGDFDGDGNIDTVSTAVGNGGKISFLSGNGDGTFDTVSDFVFNGTTLVSIGSPGDFNNDGNLDVIALGGSPNIVALALGDGAGSFSTSTPETPTGTIAHIAVADFDGDDIPDAVVARSGGADSIIHISDGDGTFSTSTVATGGNAQRIVTGDFNNDTFQDFILSQTSGSDITFVSGDGDGTFGTPSNINITGVTSATRMGAADYDGDGNLDVVLNDHGTTDVVVSLGNGDGTFAESTVYTAPAPVYGFVNDVDVDGDGDTDIVPVLSLADSLGVLINDGAGSFSVDTRTFATGNQPLNGQHGAGDFDGDGATDIATANQLDDTISIFLNTGAGGFTTTESGGSTVIAESGTADTLSVVLAAAPTANVDITTTGDSEVSISPALLTFTTANWSTSQNVTISATNDETIEGEHSSTLTLTSTSTDAFYGDQAVQTVDVTINDNDTNPTNASGGRSGGGGRSSSDDDDEDDDDSNESSSSGDLFDRIRVYLEDLQDQGKSLPSWSSVFLGSDTSSSNAVPSSIPQDLDLEAKGENVTTLQTFLIDQATGSAATALGNVGATGYFGILTQASLAEYQAAHNINPPQGYFGPITRTYLSSVGY